MAELPGELEDLVGDLMEQEEDMFDEAEDVSSSAIDSADKGAGWDATDGPISDNSAKGVTGNRLPNSQRNRRPLGRRAAGQVQRRVRRRRGGGQGRPQNAQPAHARSVSSKARSRTTASSPPAGPRGGGKESGKGGEGLEGPAAPRPGQRDAERLAGKQAALRNKAQGVDLQLPGDRASITPT